MCGSYHYVIITVTRFGHGDSATEVYCQCDGCPERTTNRHQYGFPAAMTIMREAQKDWELKNK